MGYGGGSYGRIRCWSEAVDSSVVISVMLALSLTLALIFVNPSSEYDIVGSSSIKQGDIDQPYRTGFHFQPRKNWMNDPNGPMIYKGIYHLFYQYNPAAPVWRKQIVWGHSTSTDLINWTPQRPALSPSIRSDINGCWSGSVTLLPPNSTPAILYTGLNSRDHQIQNLAVPKDPAAVDPYLRQWTVKSVPNPVIYPSPTSLINATEFRDPTTAWRSPSDGAWRVAMGTIHGDRVMAAMYRSDDFVHWTETKRPLHSANGTHMWECPDFFPVYVRRPVGAETSAVGDEVRHVLKVSLFEVSYEYYTIGRYVYGHGNDDVDVYVPGEGAVESHINGLRFDYGKFYASKTFYDGVQKRRVLWGWVNESSTHDDDLRKGWSGIQAIPRTVLLDESGKQLVMWPVREVDKLRGNRVDFRSKTLGKRYSLLEVKGITAAQADVEVKFRVKDFQKAGKFDQLAWTQQQQEEDDPQLLCNRMGPGAGAGASSGGIGPFGLLVLASSESDPDNLEEYTAVFFRIFKRSTTTAAQEDYDDLVVLMCTDLTRSSLNPTTDKTGFGAFVKVDPRRQDLSLRTLIDHSIIESFAANGKTCITARVYPTLAIHEKARLYAFNYGTDQDVEITKLTAWSMNKANVNQQPYQYDHQS